MKKLLVITFLALSLFTFAACGSSEAKVTGIKAGIINFGSDRDSYSKDCVDDSTLTTNDYIVKVGEQYQIVLQYTFTGGSRMPYFESAEYVKLIFDNDLLQIGEPSENHGHLYYPLECKEEFTCVAILIEANRKYHTELIVSAIK